MIKTSRGVLLAICLASLALKVAVVLTASLSAGIHPGLLVQGHDGFEYVLYAQLVADGEWGQLPGAIRRHHPGLALALAPGAWLLGGFPGAVPWGPDGLAQARAAWPTGLLALGGVGLGWLASVAGLLLVSRTVAAGAPRESFLAMALLGWPATVYFGLFCLAEGLFVGGLCLALWLWVLALRRFEFTRGAGGQPLFMVCGLILGVLVWVRGPALVAGVALSLAAAAVLAVRSAGRASLWKIGLVSAWPAAICILGYWLMNFFLVQVLGPGETPAARHAPRWGVPPLAGWEGMFSLGAARAVYLGACALAFAAGLILGLHNILRHISEDLTAAESPTSQRLVAVGAWAMAMALLLFHGSMKSLDYYAQTIPLANYQDRYLAAAWPFLLLCQKERLYSPWLAVGLAAASCALSLYWGLGYSRALLSGGFPDGVAAGP